MPAPAARLLPAALCAAAISSSAALAQAPIEPAAIPGGDIFGFTSASGVGEVGEHGIGVEFDGAIGKRGGRYRVFSEKFGYERVIAPDTTFGVGLFTAYHSIRNVPAEPIDRNGFQFDGLSFELGHRFVAPSATNPFGFKMAIEPRWARLTGGGRHTNAYGAELKFITDAVVVPDTLFWAGNLVLDAGSERDPDIRADWSTGSGAKLSTALAYQVQPGFLIGVEATYLRAYDDFFGRFAGDAVFLGPTIFYKLSDNAALNATIAPQIAGNANGAPGRLDLDNFERMVTRVKFSMDF